VASLVRVLLQLEQQLAENHRGLEEGLHSAQGGSIPLPIGQSKKFNQQGTNGYWQTLRDIIPNFCTLH
jgi:hypothetical protein